MAWKKFFEKIKIKWIAIFLIFVSLIGSIASILSYLSPILEKREKIGTTLTVAIVSFIVLIFFLGLIIKKISEEEISIKCMQDKIDDIHKCIKDNGDLLESAFNEINKVELDEIVEIEKEAKVVWIFTPDLRIDRDHPKFTEVIGNNLRAVENGESKEYRYILPKSIVPANVDKFKNIFRDKIFLNKENVKEEEVDKFFDKLFYKIPADPIIRDIMQETVIYNPKRKGEAVFQFPFGKKLPQFAYKITENELIEPLIKEFEEKCARYKNIKISEREANRIYVITEDLSLDLNGKFWEDVKDNLKKEALKKKEMCEDESCESIFFDCKYRYILFRTRDLDRGKLLDKNRKNYRRKILKHISPIKEEELFLEINLNINSHIARIFGAIFQERTIYFKDDMKNPLYYHIRTPNDTKYVDYIRLEDGEEDKDLIESFTKSFNFIWKHSHNTIKRRLESGKKTDRKKGREAMGVVIEKIWHRIVDYNDKENIDILLNLFEQTSKNKLNYCGGIALRKYINSVSTDHEQLINIWKANQLRDIINKYHWGWYDPPEEDSNTNKTDMEGNSLNEK